MKPTDVIPDAGEAAWQRRLDLIVQTMREMSLHTDPQAMVVNYRRRMQELDPTDGMVALSRRDLAPPRYRITRSSLWNAAVNPWKDKEQLPVLERGLLGELIYADRPRIINELRLEPDDPAAEYLAGQRSLLAIPLFDQGVALNMVILTKNVPDGFSYQRLPDVVQFANLFGRATHNLVLRDELRAAYAEVDYELKMVGDLQRSLLPARLPEIPSLTLAAHYQTSRRAGGDYYDLFPLSDGRWGILIADVSGHGTPAAVMMAVTHGIAHSFPGEPDSPGRLLEFVNRKLTERYTRGRGTFVTAFYGVFDPRSLDVTYASAGHNPPRLKGCSAGAVRELDAAVNLPLGIELDEPYAEATLRLSPGDQLVLYTDGITEARNAAGEMFGVERLDQALSGCRSASDLLQELLATLERFTGGHPADDDRTLLIATAVRRS